MELISETTGMEVAVRKPEMYLSYRLHPSHNFHLEISKVLKECVIGHYGRDASIGNNCGENPAGTIVRIGKSIPCGCDAL